MPEILQAIKQGGLWIPQLDHRDRDYLKSFHPEILVGAAKVPTFPDEYTTDAGLWVPNQNEVNPEFPNTPPQPYGCTNFVTGDISADLDGILKDPYIIEAITHANARGGYDVRESLKVAKTIGWITGFYNIKAYAPLDYFDAMRLAMLSGIPEKRSISVATPWYPVWQDDAVKKNAVMKMPDTLDYTGLGWHNWKIGGWTKMNGSPIMKVKPLEGKGVGDNGVLYFDRSIINAVMGLKYAMAFTATHLTPKSIYKVDMAAYDKLYSFLQTMLGLRY